MKEQIIRGVGSSAIGTISTAAAEIGTNLSGDKGCFVQAYVDTRPVSTIIFDILLTGAIFVILTKFPQRHS